MRLSPAAESREVLWHSATEAGVLLQEQGDVGQELIKTSSVTRLSEDKVCNENVPDDVE
jgi:hypothetical protein